MRRGSCVEINDARYAGVLPRRVLDTTKIIIISITFAPTPALERGWFFQIKSASPNGGRKREGETVRLRMTDRWSDSHGRKVHILLNSQAQTLFIDVQICYVYTCLSTSQRRDFKYYGGSTVE